MKHVYNCTSHRLKTPEIVQADGPYVVDRNGKRYLDLEAGVWCVSIGHGDERILETIARQSAELMHAGFCYSHQVVPAAAKSVLDITGLTGGSCVFLCSGSEAIEITRQIARHLSGKPISMTLHDSYLGAYRSVSDRSTGWFTFDWTRCTACERRDECDPDCSLVRDIPDRISDFVFEPGSSSGYVRFPPEPLLHNIVAAVRANGGMLIANEVTTGVGRTGRWWGFQHYGISPDMVAIGKGIGNGYPVSVAAISSRVMEQLKHKPFKYSQSHQNDPLGAAVVNEVIRAIEADNLIANAAEAGAELLAQLEQLVDGAVLRAVRGRGLMIAVDLADAEITDEIHDRLIESGYIVGNRGTSFRIDPPLAVTREQLGGFAAELGGIVRSYR
jgi:acetylornithine/N-succinyldiaminopimelate aminotransferase